MLFLLKNNESKKSPDGNRATREEDSFTAIKSDAL